MQGRELVCVYLTNASAGVLLSLAPGLGRT